MTTPDGDSIRRIASGSADFREVFNAVEARGEADLDRVDGDVRAILSDVRERGDAAVFDAVAKFEGRQPEPLFMRSYDGASQLEALPKDQREALQFAADRIATFHQQQLRTYKTLLMDSDGVRLASRATPLQRVGVYAPGGKAAYPSSVLMSVIIARVAGVEDIIVASPDPSPIVRAACHLAGATGLLDAGGAQAVAALAYGTRSVPAVDKIVGPGNIYVAAAKRMVFGTVDIDSIAGPSEILVIADASADPKVVAADLLSQAEHDESAYPLLLCDSESLADAIEAEVFEQLVALPRREIAATSVRNNGLIVLADSREQMLELGDRLAAEHVSVQTRDAREFAEKLRHAGAIFIGHHTPEAAGDYVAGPSHVLPTGGAARFASPLGIYDFLTHTSLIEYSREGLQRQSASIETLAEAEGLTAHAEAVRVRLRRG